MVPSTNGHAIKAFQFEASTVESLAGTVVGRRREIELVVASLGAGRNVLLEGPPGTGKSTLLSAVTKAAGLGYVFVEGNAELTPSRLVGHHDPSRVLTEGYSESIFIDGPLVSAMREGSILYLEEINRIPEETINVLVTVMSEKTMQVPRLGRLYAKDGFAIVAAMNPYDTIGTARISPSIYDRMCRVRMDYQTPEEELRIVQRSIAGTPPVSLLARAVELVRRTRDHPDVRIGSSVRGAIDMAEVANELAMIRAKTLDQPDVWLDAALAALSGRIRISEGSERSSEDVIEELWRSAFTRSEGQLAPELPTPERPDPAGSTLERVADRGLRPGQEHKGPQIARKATGCSDERATKSGSLDGSANQGLPAKEGPHSKKAEGLSLEPASTTWIGRNLGKPWAPDGRWPAGA